MLPAYSRVEISTGDNMLSNRRISSVTAILLAMPLAACGGGTGGVNSVSGGGGGGTVIAGGGPPLPGGCGACGGGGAPPIGPGGGTDYVTFDKLSTDQYFSAVNARVDLGGSDGFTGPIAQYGAVGYDVATNTYLTDNFFILRDAFKLSTTPVDGKTLTIDGKNAPSLG